MKLSEYGARFLAREEGMRLKAYQDVKGVWTIGIGHTRTAKPGMVITEEEAHNLFDEDVAWAEDAARDVGEVEQHQFDMLVSLIFNIGIGAWRRSTVRRRMIAGERDGKALQTAWLAWRRSGNNKTILLPRRRREWVVFVYGYDYV